MPLSHLTRLKGGNNTAQGNALGIALPHYSKPGRGEIASRAFRQTFAVGSRSCGGMSPLQGLSKSLRYSQGVALGWIIPAFQVGATTGIRRNVWCGAQVSLHPKAAVLLLRVSGFELPSGFGLRVSDLATHAVTR